MYFWKRKKDKDVKVEEQIPNNSGPLTVKNRSLRDWGAFSGLGRKFTKKSKIKGIEIKRLPKHKSMPKTRDRKLRFQKIFKKSNLASKVYKDGGRGPKIVTGVDDLWLEMVMNHQPPNSPPPPEKSMDDSFELNF